jgi:hypothetical protein
MQVWLSLTLAQGPHLEIYANVFWLPPDHVGLVTINDFVWQVPSINRVSNE